MWEALSPHLQYISISRHDRHESQYERASVIRETRARVVEHLASISNCMLQRTLWIRSKLTKWYRCAEVRRLAITSASTTREKRKRATQQLRTLSPDVVVLLHDNLDMLVPACLFIQHDCDIGLMCTKLRLPHSLSTDVRPTACPTCGRSQRYGNRWRTRPRFTGLGLFSS
jgi:hypothetical protein